MKTTIEGTQDTVISRILNTKAKHGFIPTPSFYGAVGINKKRWAMLFRNEISPTWDELIALCKYFEAELKEFV